MAKKSVTILMVAAVSLALAFAAGCGESDAQSGMEQLRYKP